MVIVSLSEWHAMKETPDLLSDRADAAFLRRGIGELNAGRVRCTNSSTRTPPAGKPQAP
jgi:PHD/YefM family antitoxin component YafN of YafNO toxin-antitoxin module